MNYLDRTPNWPFVTGTVALLALTVWTQPAWRKIEVETVRPRSGAQLKLPFVLERTAISPALDTPMPDLPPLAGNLAGALPSPELPRQYAEPAPRVAARVERPSARSLPELRGPLSGAALPESPGLQEQSALVSEPLEEPLPQIPALPEAAPQSPGALAARPAAHGGIKSDSLAAEIEKFAQLPDEQDWARRVGVQLAALSQTEGLGDSALGPLLKELVTLTAEAHRNTQPPVPVERQTEWRRVHYALTRRLDLWQLGHAAALAGDKPNSQPNLAKIHARSQAAQRRVAALPQGDSWNRYLQLPSLTSASAPGDKQQPAESLALAAKALANLTSRELSAAQREVVELPELRELAASLRVATSEPLPLSDLVALVERYEQQPSAAAARQLSASALSLGTSESALLTEFGNRLDSHYRNANFRLAISGDLINQLLPVFNSIQEDVNDQILGAQVSGTSDVSTRLRVRLVPDRLRLRLGLEASGTVNSETSATKGPVTFYNSGNSTFVARKSLFVDQEGVRSSTTQVEANTHNNMHGMNSQYDGVPLVGALVRKQARSEHAASRHEADREAESRVSQRARQRLDSAVQASLAKAEARLRREVLQPLAALSLVPEPMELLTTEQRLIARYRLATDEQLAAHTPRPVAPGNSLLSVQMHESLLNNVVGQMNLAGRRLELKELFRELQRALGQQAHEVAADLPEGVMLQFAAQDPISLHCREGEMALTVRLAELSQGKNCWKNFTVVGRYVPDASLRSPTLVREGSIELAGERLGFRDQVALRGIFSKAFDKRRPIPVFDPRFLADERLANLELTQFALDRGWLALAFAEKASAAAQPSAASAGDSTAARPRATR